MLTTKYKGASNVLRFLWLSFLYCLIVVGGTTLFLIIAPLLGYLPYSDRPGPGWVGTFSGIPWDAFWANMRVMISLGFFILLVIACPGAIITAVMLWLEHLRVKPAILRTIGGILGGLVALYAFLIIAWYIAAGTVLLLVVLLLGVVAGLAVLPHRNSECTLASNKTVG